MEKGKIIVIEGACDGIGKTTQFEMLQKEYKNNYVTHHFPSYKTYHGHGVEEYMAGNFGEIKDLSPYFIHNLYAHDRAVTWFTELKPEYDKGNAVLLDRYTSSSEIYQCCLIESEEERKKFVDYVEDNEFNKIGIGRPDSVIFLTAPFDLVTKLREERNKKGENAFGEKADIHERDINHLRKVYENALFVANYLKWDVIKCNEGDRFKTPDEIHAEIMDTLNKKKLTLQMDK